MGQSSSTTLDKSVLLANYNEIQTQSDLGVVLSHKVTKQTYLLKELNFPEQTQYKKSLTHYQTKRDQPQENVLNLLQIENQSKSLFCSEIYRLSLIYQFSKITLDKEIEARQQQLRYFEEQDIWSILQSCFYGLMQIKDKMILQTNRVYIMTNGEVKIIDSDLITNNSWYMLDQNLYYSPQRFENFDSSYKVNTTEQDVVFSLGATLLNTAILQNIFDCYEYGSHRFNHKKLQLKLSKLSKLYSEDFYKIICGMLESDSNNRMTMKQIELIIGKMTTEYTDEQEEESYSNKKYQASYQQQYKQSIKESMPQSVRQSISNITRQQQTHQPFRQINNYFQDHNNAVNYQKYQKEFIVSNPPPSIKFKNIQIKTSLEPIIEQNITRQYTKFEPVHFQNYKEVDKSQFESVYPRGGQNSNMQSAISHNITNSPSAFYGQLEPIRQKNVSQFNHSPNYLEKNPYPSSHKIDSYKNDENLFTDPRLMEQIRRDMCQITARRSLMPTPSKPSYSGYSTYQQSSRYHQPINAVPVQYQQPKLKPEIYYEQDGKVFEGAVINGMKQGFGKLSYPQGPYYLGNFQNDKMHGQGVLYYDEGKPAYDGQWYQDQFHGKGSLFNQNPLYQSEPFDYHDFNLVEDYWTKYQGQFVSDNKEGLGKLYLSNGEMFEGYFEKDCINGQGVFQNKYGQRFEGKWDNNILMYQFSA